MSSFKSIIITLVTPSSALQFTVTLTLVVCCREAAADVAVTVMV
jgi:hypothetical protein